MPTVFTYRDVTDEYLAEGRAIVEGLYASATSSKAHQYAADMSADIGGREVQTQPKLMANGHNALIVCAVAVGNGYKEASAAWGGPNKEYKPENCTNFKPNSLGTDYDSSWDEMRAVVASELD